MPSLMPMMPFRGVRSSWLTLLMKRSFCSSSRFSSSISFCTVTAQHAEQHMMSQNCNRIQGVRWDEVDGSMTSKIALGYEAYTGLKWMACVPHIMLRAVSSCYVQCHYAVSRLFHYAGQDTAVKSQWEPEELPSTVYEPPPPKPDSTQCFTEQNRGSKHLMNKAPEPAAALTATRKERKEKRREEKKRKEKRKREKKKRKEKKRKEKKRKEKEKRRKREEKKEKKKKRRKEEKRKEEKRKEKKEKKRKEKNRKEMKRKEKKRKEEKRKRKEEKIHRQ
ncbi:hypothetical protein DUNSADRAFT_4974 [Dunaliella salina]|uniref:Uncharacterized protein n=1 Tax=Dunaliella salina TaxID=3046 RepID=A0ABQ7GQW6_DUNSA|nr:hypothetical protein DUNSADRAFT_4974 [Dunaliella salina]|eukprot:KAF5837001.1 hypothetical protein DUNSADRAFT_4974 [Dunaliella salina]